MGVYTNAVQQLYVAYFGRPADAAGLAYWEGVVTKANGDTSAVSAAFAASAEYKAAYAGLDAYHVVAQVYQNLFGHAPDLAGLNFWGQALIAGQITIDNAVTQIAAGAQGSDMTAYNNKVAAATAFSAALDTPAEVLAYSGDAANAAAKAFIAGVTDDASLKAAIDPTALNNTVANIVDAGNTGKEFNLTIGQDTIVGTAGNDIINAPTFNASTGASATTLKSFDSIDGGAGKDTLNLDLTGGVNTITGTIKNVEIINLTGSTGTVDASAFQGATNINFDASSAPAVTNLDAGTTAGFTKSTGAISVGAAGASASIALDNVAETASITVGGPATGSTLAAVTVSGTRADTDKNGSLASQTLNFTAGKNVQAVTVTTNQATSLSLAEAGDSTKHITSLDASASTGKIAITGNATLNTIKTGTGNDSVTITAAVSAATSSAAAVNATVSTGDGNDTIIVSTVGDGSTSVDAGAGNDKITVNKDAGAVSILGGAGNDTIVINGTLTTSDVVSGGEGTDTIQLAGASTRTADDYIVFNKLVTGFETISFSSAETALDASKLAATYTGIDLATDSIVTGVGAQAITAHGNVELTAAGFKENADVTKITYAGTLGVSDDKSGTVTAHTDVLNLTVKATTANTDVLLAGHAQTANITLTNSVNASSNPTADTFASVTIDNTSANEGLKSVTLTGNGSAFVTNVDGMKLVTVDASGLGGTLTLGDNAGKATGGLNYMSTNTAAETIKLGSGIDHIALGASTYDSIDTVTGLKLAVDSDGNLTADSDVLNVAGVSSVVAADAKFTTKQTDIDLALKDAAQATATKGDTLVFQLGGDTYVFHDDGNHVINSADTVVKLTGTIDLDALVASLNHGLV